MDTFRGCFHALYRNSCRSFQSLLSMRWLFAFQNHHVRCQGRVSTLARRTRSVNHFQDPNSGFWIARAYFLPHIECLALSVWAAQTNVPVHVLTSDFGCII
jgi:hypothetical protein